MAVWRHKAAPIMLFHPRMLTDSSARNNTTAINPATISMLCVTAKLMYRIVRECHVDTPFSSPSGSERILTASFSANQILVQRFQIVRVENPPDIARLTSIEDW